ncbi:MAG: hypothetical protein HRU38_15310 [Saccharospirillaceae bacterium]|nr:hypothetical protein [Pseudomonadales bacterium]NRB80011.1 hypothetical protein [Saccharospirillaceae bacterium]
MRLIIPLLLLITSCFLQAKTIKPFTSDGCSSFPNGTFKQKELWLSCCADHDVAYWKGGTYKQRLEADKDLRQCVADVGEPQIALLMLAGVRVGGNPFINTPFRWGYGWPYPRFYKALTQDEKQQISALNKID